MLAGTERAKMKILNCRRASEASRDTLDASIHKVTPNLSLEFDKSTFSLSTECQTERKGEEGDGGRVC